LLQPRRALVGREDAVQEAELERSGLRGGRGREGDGRERGGERAPHSPSRRRRTASTTMPTRLAARISGEKMPSPPASFRPTAALSVDFRAEGASLLALTIASSVVMPLVGVMTGGVEGWAPFVVGSGAVASMTCASCLPSLPWLSSAACCAVVSG